jgi:hypothetical protein
LYDYDDLDRENHTNNNIKLMFDKSTQKHYITQNHDLFPNMYDVIDATVDVENNSNKNTSNKKIQTKQYIYKDFPTPYSSYSP